MPIRFKHKIAVFSAATLAASTLIAPVALMQSSVPFGTTQCSDGEDNDGDFFTDYLSDPGCESPTDNDERNTAPTSSQGSTYECSDGIDNDNDIGTDETDFSCSSPMDDDESNPTAACNDGRDNDGDGLRDREDAGCFGPQDNDESGSTSISSSSSLSSSTSFLSAAQTASSQDTVFILPPAEGSASSVTSTVPVTTHTSSSSRSRAAAASSKMTSVRGYSVTEAQPYVSQGGSGTILLAAASGKAYPGTVTIKLEPDSREVRAGSTLGFAVTVANHSPSIAGGLTIEIAFDPTDFDVTGADKAILETGKLRWVNGGLQANDSKELKFTVKVNPNLTHGHVIRMRATLSGEALSGPVSTGTEAGVVGSLPATGSMRLKPLY